MFEQANMFEQVGSWYNVLSVLRAQNPDDYKTNYLKFCAIYDENKFASRAVLINDGAFIIRKRQQQT